LRLPVHHLRRLQLSHLHLRPGVMPQKQTRPQTQTNRPRPRSQTPAASPSPSFALCPLPRHSHPLSASAFPCASGSPAATVSIRVAIHGCVALQAFQLATLLGFTSSASPNLPHHLPASTTQSLHSNLLLPRAPTEGKAMKRLFESAWKGPRACSERAWSCASACIGMRFHLIQASAI
jgi:hypothetical protein